ncbi:MAG: aldehyde ferredoxin oxidoreductase C-terminal domain-containing protein [Anaerolineae bacterium]
MAIGGGYQGKLLEVNLTKGETCAVPLPAEDVLRQWVGGTGLGLYLLAREITPQMQATDPGCPCFVITGPLTGSLAPSSSNWTIINLRSAPSYHPGVSQAHGYVGAYLKHAGWDGIILRGASAEPVYLWIDGDKVELRDARPYWGRTTFETVRRIKIDLGDVTSIAVACIGPGGENLLPLASVRDGVWGASMGEAGNAWGAKKLKAIAVRGSGRVPIADLSGFLESCERWRDVLYSQDQSPQWHAGKHGFTADYDGRVPFRNMGAPGLQYEWVDRQREDIPKWKNRPIGSWNCEFACHHEATVTTGPMAGTKCAGYFGEVIQEMGPNLGITDPGVAVALTGVVDGLGLAAAGVPRTIAMIMEAYNSERISRDQTDGIDLTWGNYEGVMNLLEKAVRREGIGAIVAKPITEAARELGIEDLAVHIKGTGGNDHDQRWHPGILFQSLVVSGAGPTWQTAWRAMERDERDQKGGEPDQGYEWIPGDNWQSLKIMPKYLYDGQKKKLWEDCIGSCAFLFRGHLGSWDQAINCLATAVGWEGYDRDESLLVGERITNLQRLISLFKGYKPEYDFHVSERLLSIPSDWPSVPEHWPKKGKPMPLGPVLSQWRDEYYHLLDWDPQTGLPSAGALRKVGLTDFKVGRD